MAFVSVKPIANPLTQLLDVDVPVVCAPLARAANATLAIHASLGGGFGFIPTGYDGAVGIRRELTAVKAAIEARGVPLPFHLPVGVNLLGWKLEETGAELKAVLDTALEHRVQAIWLGFGKGLRHYVSHIRQHDLACGQKTLVFIGVNTVPEALLAANEFKADVIVAQGVEAGVQVPTLVSNIVSVLPKEGPLVLAAPSIATGVQVPSLLNLGAAGVVLGSHHHALQPYGLQPYGLHTYGLHQYGERIVSVRL